MISFLNIFLSYKKWNIHSPLSSGFLPRDSKNAELLDKECYHFQNLEQESGIFQTKDVKFNDTVGQNPHRRATCLNIVVGRGTGQHACYVYMYIY